MSTLPVTTTDTDRRRAIRARFPALTGSTTFFENAGGAQLPDTVIESVTRFFRTSYVQIGAGYGPSNRAGRVIEEAHTLARRIVGATNGETILGPSSSVLQRMLSECYGDILAPGREIVIAESGHESSISPWLRLERKGIVIRWWTVDPATGELPLAALDSLLNDRTALVLFPHVSNLLGAVVDVAAATAKAHAAGARVIVDGVAYAPHRPIDVDAWDVDWYAYSAYKVYGPHLAILYGRRDALAELTGPNHDFIPRDQVPYKFELGGACHEGCAALLGLSPYLEFLAGDGATAPELPDEPVATDRATIRAAFERMATLEMPLQERLIDWLRSRPRVTIHGPASAGVERVPTISFRVAAKSSAEICHAAHAAGIGIRNGHMYSVRLAERLGLDLADGVVRMSLVHYNTPEEIERLVAVLDPLLS